MPDLIPVSAETLAHKYWRRPTDLSHGAQDTFCPLTLSELAQAATAFPIALVPNGDSFSLAAVQSFELGKNLFTSPDGRWLSSYVPISYSTYPFRLTRTQDGTVVFCIVNENDIVTDNNSDHPFFDDEGNLDPLVQQVFDTLSRSYSESEVLASVISNLHQLELIAPWDISISRGENLQKIEGLFRIDEGALNTLSDEDFLQLRTQGALVPAYCQLISMQLLPELIKLDQAYSQMHEDSRNSLSEELKMEFSNDSGTLDLSNL